MKDDQFPKLSDLTAMSAAAIVMESFKKFNNPVSVLGMESTNKLKILMQRVSELSKMELPKPWLCFSELPKMELPKPILPKEVKIPVCTSSIKIAEIKFANGFQNFVQRASELSKMELQKPLFLDEIKSTSGSNENIVHHIEALLDLGLEQEKLQFFQDYDDCVINDIATITEYRANFNNAIAAIEKILNTSIDSTVENCLYRLLYANVITALETYLSDAFINTVLSNPSFVRRLVETTPKFKDEKITFSEIYESISNIEVKIREYLADFIWHNLAVVEKMYKGTLNIKFPDKLGAVYKAIAIRHHIVHRNGKDKSGKEKIISRQDITNLIAEIEELVQHIDSSLNELKSKSSTDTKNIWDAIQTFRNQLEPGDLEPDEDVFAEVRDSSPGREVSF